MSYLENIYENQIIYANQNIFSVTPAYEIDDFFAVLRMPTANSGKVNINQKVNIRLDGFPQAEYGLLNGFIKEISDVPNEDFFLVTVNLEKGLNSTFGKVITYSPDMSGTGNIITEDLRLIERFFYQFRDIFLR